MGQLLVGVDIVAGVYQEGLLFGLDIVGEDGQLGGFELGEVEALALVLVVKLGLALWRLGHCIGKEL